MSDFLDLTPRDPRIKWRTLPSGKLQGRLFIGRHPITNEGVRLERSGDDRPEVVAALMESLDDHVWRNNARASHWPDASVREYLLWWANDPGRMTNANTQRNRLLAVGTVGAFLSHRKLRELTEDDVRAFFEMLISDGVPRAWLEANDIPTRRKGERLHWQVGSARVYKSALHQALVYAHRRHWVREVATAHIDLRMFAPEKAQPAFATKQVKDLTKEELRVLMDQIDDEDEDAEGRVLRLSEDELVRVLRAARCSTHRGRAGNSGEARDQPGTPAIVDGVHPYYPVIYLAVASCLRIGELLGLLWSDFDLDAPIPTVNIRRQLTMQGTYTDPKSKASKAKLPLAPATVRELRAHQARMDSLGYRTDGPTPVFVGERGEVAARGRVGYWWRHKVLPAAGVDEIKFHALRATGISRLADAGESPARLKELARHAKMATTDRYYTKIASDALHAAVSAHPLPDLFPPDDDNVVPLRREVG